MLSFEEEEDDDDNVVEEEDDGAGTAAEEVNANHPKETHAGGVGPMIRIKSTDSDNNVEHLSRRLLEISWRDLYYDSSNREHEKIYEDLCYITFSSQSLPEVVQLVTPYFLCFPVVSHVA